MQKPDRSKTWSRVARIAALGVGGLLLAGCATGYSFVQPEVAGSGGYYTGAEPYSGQGYYDYYGTGPYYPGTSGWGYYNGTSPYSNPFGWYGGYNGGYYGGYGYGPQFNIGISNVWDFPGYWGPWYSTGFPIWSCAGRRCDHWRRHRHHRWDQDRHHHHGSDPSSKVVLKPERPPVRLRMERDGAPTAVPARPLARRWAVEGLPARRSPEATNFAPHDFVRAPIRRPAEGARFDQMPARSAYVPRVSEHSAFADRRGMSAPVSAPRAAHPIGRPSYRPQPVRVAPVVASPPHNTRATKTEIP